MSAQVLDSMEIERERGITIKAQTAALHYKAQDGKIYNLNLIDTPGHVDFSYEVSRSLSACEGALLVVDASQGVEAQTVANCYTAIELGVEVLPVLNKMDLPQADPDGARQEVEDVIGIDASQAVLASAKTGMGIDEILEAIVARVPAPQGDPEAPLQALIIDSWFDNYVGVVMLVRIVNGMLKPKDKILLMASGATHLCEQTGVFTPKSQQRPHLSAGEVGFIIAGIKQLEDAKVGDTVTLASKPAAAPLPGFKEVKPQVFAGLYPVESSEYDQLRDSLEAQAERRRADVRARSVAGVGLWLSLRLPRPAAHGDRAGAPGARVRHGHHHHRAVGGVRGRAARWFGDHRRKPIAHAGNRQDRRYPRADREGHAVHAAGLRRSRDDAMQQQARRADQHELSRPPCTSVYEIPLAEIVLDFFDKLKSVSRGYASMDYEFLEYRSADVVRVDLLINNDRVDALAVIVHRSNARHRARDVVTRMRGLIPRQMFDVVIQAAIGAEIIARENVKALRKNVLAKCYGGDISRKKKLLEKQKAGKKRMKQVGTVEIPQEAFLAILQVEDK